MAFFIGRVVLQKEFREATHLLIYGFGDTNTRIDRMTDTDDLKSILKDVNENIDWYNKTVETFDNVKFIFSLYNR